MRRGSWRGSRAARGVLIVEALLATVVIAVGLALITRALAGQLKALRLVEDYAMLTDLAREVFADVERSVQEGESPQREPTGEFEAPHAGYRWALSARSVEDDDAEFPKSLVTLSVSRSGQEQAAV